MRREDEEEEELPVLSVFLIFFIYFRRSGSFFFLSDIVGSCSFFLWRCSSIACRLCLCGFFFRIEGSVVGRCGRRTIPYLT